MSRAAVDPSLADVRRRLDAIYTSPPAATAAPSTGCAGAGRGGEGARAAREDRMTPPRVDWLGLAVGVALGALFVCIWAVTRGCGCGY